MRFTLLVFMVYVSTMCFSQARKEHDSINHKTAVDLIKSGKYFEAIKLLDSPIDPPLNLFAGLSQNNLGYIYTKLGDYDSAQYHYQTAVNIYDHLELYEKKAQSLLNSATVYKSIGLYEEALKQCRSAKTIIDMEQMQRELGIYHSLTGNIYRELGDYKRAISNEKRCLKIAEQSQDTIGALSALNNLGNSYLATSKPNLALKRFIKYLSGSITIQDTLRIGRAHTNVARSYLHLNKYDSVYKHLESARAYLETDSVELPALFIAEANFHLKIGSYNLAINKAKEAKLLAAKYALQPEILESLEVLVKATKALGNKNKQLFYLEESIVLSDSLLHRTKISRIHNAEIQSLTDKKNHQIQQFKTTSLLREKEVNVKKIQLLFSLLITGLVLTILLLVYRAYLSKRKFVEEYFSSDKGVILKGGNKISFKDIVMIQPLRNDLIITLEDKDLIEKRTTLKDFYNTLPKIDFGRPQQSTIVNFSHLEKVQRTYIYIADKKIAISPSFKEDFLDSWDKYKSCQ